MQIEDKVARLQAILHSYERVAIAFSGGIDSSLLLKYALTTLGAGNVLVLFGKSELVSTEESARAETWLADNGYPHGVEMEVVPLQPLSWKEFVCNGQDRCYFCKLRIYLLFQERMEKMGFSTLVDGTNIDDLKGKRAGLRAIHELGVKMPLVQAGLDKADIRSLGKHLGIKEWNKPSASCLATRIPQGLSITIERLKQIEAWERWLENFGYAGCRVRMDKEKTDIIYIEIPATHIEALAKQNNRLTLLHFFKKNGIRKVFLDLEGR